MLFDLRLRASVNKCPRFSTSLSDGSGPKGYVLKIVMHDALMIEPAQGHAQCPDLAHARTVAPAGTGKSDLDRPSFGVTLNPHVESTAVQE